MSSSRKKNSTILFILMVTLYFPALYTDEREFGQAAINCDVTTMAKAYSDFSNAIPNEAALIGQTTPLFDVLNNRPSTTRIPEEQILDTVTYLLGDTVMVKEEKYTLAAPYKASHKRTSDGKLPLHIAAFYGHNKAVEYLLKKGEPDDIYSMDNYKGIPLTYAINGRIESTVELLFQHMTDSTKINPTSITDILRLAIKSNSQKIIDLIFKDNNIFANYLTQYYKTNVDDIELLYPLSLAIEYNKEKAIDWILKYGDKTLKAKLNSIVPNENPLQYILIIACQKGTLSIVKKLVEAGCDITKCDYYGSPLSTAAYQGQLDIVTYLLSLKADPNQVCIINGTKLSPLISAVSDHSSIGLTNISQVTIKTIVQKLLDSGANINTPGHDAGRLSTDVFSPLYLALLNGWFKAAALLKLRGATLANNDIKDNLFKKEEATKPLIENILSEKNAVDADMIEAAAKFTETNNLVAYQWLTVKGLINEDKKRAKAYNKFGWTLLHEVAQQSIPSAATAPGEILIDYMVHGGVREFEIKTTSLTEEQTELFNTLKNSIKKDNIDFLALQKILNTNPDTTLEALARQSSVKQSVDLGLPLDTIIKTARKNREKAIKTTNRPSKEEAQNHLDTVAAQTMIPFLVGNGLTVDVIDFDGRTPLHIAAINDQTGETINALNKANANLLKQDLLGATTFHLAAQNNNIVGITTLLELGKNALNLYNTTVDALGKTALHEAALNNATEIIALLIQGGWKVDAPDAQGNTPLHLAAFRGNAQAVETLISKGASVTSINKDGQTPAHLAADKEPRITDTSGILSQEKKLMEGQKSNPALCLKLLYTKDPKLAVIKDNKSKTPFAYAYSHNNKETKDVLLGQKPSVELYESLIEDKLVGAFTDLIAIHKLPKDFKLANVKEDWAIIAIENIQNAAKNKNAIQEKLEKADVTKQPFIELATALARI